MKRSSCGEEDFAARVRALCVEVAEIQAALLAPQLEGQLGAGEHQRLALEVVDAGALLQPLEMQAAEAYRPVELHDARQDREAGEMSREMLERRRHAQAV